jgi:hypothetical protein
MTPLHRILKAGSHGCQNEANQGQVVAGPPFGQLRLLPRWPQLPETPESYERKPGIGEYIRTAITNKSLI